MRRDQKVREVERLSDRLEKAKSLVFSDYRGLKVSEMNELRSRLRKSDSSFKVVKNRLMKRALAARGLDSLAGYLSGPTAIAASNADPVNPAKVLVEFAKAHEHLVLKGGILGGKILARSDIEALAKLPTRDELLSRALASLMAPANNFVSVLAALPRKLVYALNAIKETKQS